MRDHDVDTAIRRFYSDPGVVGGYTAVAAQGLAPFEAALIRRAFAPGQRVLDVGCGGGREAIAMARAGIRVVAIDLILPMVRMTVAHAAGQQMRLDALTGNATALPFRDKTFDGVAMLGNLIAFVPTRAERLAAFQATWRVLRPGGILTMTTHNRRSHWKFRLYFACVNRWRGLARWFGRPRVLGENDRWSRHDRIGRPLSGQRLFLHMYDLDEATVDLQEAGFEVLEARARGEYERDCIDPRLRRLDYLLGFLARRPDHSS